MKIILKDTDELKSGVYQIRNVINNKVYIGSTITTFKKRLLEHLFLLSKNIHHSKHLQKAFNKYGNDNFEFKVIEICTKENIIEREQFWLDQYKSFNRNLGYNILSKAYNSQGYKHTEETKFLIGQLSKLRDNTKAVLAMQKKNLGSKKDKAHCIRMSKIHSKSVIQLDLKGNFIKKWNSIEEAKKPLNIGLKDSNISKCCNGKCKSYRGFMWVKEIDYNPNKKYIYNPIINGIK